MGALRLSVAPAAQPVSLADAKAHARVDLSVDDTLLTAMILAAKDKIEELTGRKFITQTWIWTFDAFPSTDRLLLPLARVSSVPSIVTTDRTGATALFDSSKYIADVINEPAQIVLKAGNTWPAPADQLQEVNGVTLTFVVGYGAAGSNVPESILLAIKILAAHYYENRELIAPLSFSKIPMSEAKIPMSVMALIEPARAWNRFGHASK